MRKRLTFLVRVAATLLACSAVFSAFAAEHAGTSPQNDQPVDAQASEALLTNADGSIVTAAFRMTERGLVQLTSDEFRIILARTQSESEEKKVQELSGVPDISVCDPGGVPFVRYAQKVVIEESHRLDLRSRVTPYIQNEGTYAATAQFDVMLSQTTAANVTLSSQEIKALRTVTDLPYPLTYEYSGSVSSSHAPGMQSWMEFYPVMYNTCGFMEHGTTAAKAADETILSAIWTDLYYPRELSDGTLDGVFLMLEKPLQTKAPS